jgi:beta-N-acetylhexosaminidase
VLKGRLDLAVATVLTAGLTFLALSAVAAAVRPGSPTTTLAVAGVAQTPGPLPKFHPRVVEPRVGKPAVATTTTDATPAASPAPKHRHSVTVRAKTHQPGIGQLIMTRMAGTYPSRSLLSRVRHGQVGAVILFADNIRTTGQVVIAVKTLQAAAHAGAQPRLLVATDQEGGAVRRFQTMAPMISPAATTSVSQARQEGAAAASQLRTVGVNVNLAPVADVPDSSANFLARADRAYEGTPDRVAELACAFAAGTRSEGVLPTLKHFPGLGRATANTDLAAVTISAAASTLRADLMPYQRCANTSIVMVSNAAYPQFGDSAPAVLSPMVVNGVLRQQLGFDGVTISDELQTPGVTRYTDAPARAVSAGIDILLYGKTEGASAAAYSQLLSARRSGQLDAAVVSVAVRRVVALKKTLG